MAEVELLVTRSSRSSSPGGRLVAPETTSRPLGFYSDGEGDRSNTPPPDYETFLSDSELPSARIRRGIAARERHTSPAHISNYSTFKRENDETESNFNESSVLIRSGSQSLAQTRDQRRDTYDDLVPLTKKKRLELRLKKIFTPTRIIFLTLFVILSISFFAVNDELEEHYLLSSVRNNNTYRFRPQANKNINQKWYGMRLHMRGPFYDMEYAGSDGTNRSKIYYKNNDFVINNDEVGDSTDCKNFFVICLTNSAELETENACELLSRSYSKESCTTVQLLNNTEKLELGEHENDNVIKRHLLIKENATYSDKNLTLHFLVSTDIAVHFEFAVIGEVLSTTWQIVLAGLILVVVYILIIFDLVHRTIAAIIGSTTVLGVLSMLHMKPTLETTVEWISLETICLLFGMMVLVAIFSQTGFFDYFAVKCYRLSRGRVWPLICLLCLFSATVSAFLDNVTTILLLTPVSIRLCQVLNLDPVPILIAEVLFSNIGGTATAIGDPPNVIIVSHPFITSRGVNFAEFTLHLLIGIILCTIAAFGLLAVYYRVLFIGKKDKDPPHIAELKREIAIWERTARLMPTVSLEERAIREAIRAKAREVKGQLKEQRNLTAQSAYDLWRKNLVDLESRYTITDKILLLKSSIVLLAVIVLFFTSHFIPFIDLNLGWIAVFGALVLLLLADVQDIEAILHKVEWGTLLFFAGLFVLMEGLAELGLMEFIGNITVGIIKTVDKEEQLLVAIVLIIWVSAIASSFIDNIPFTQAMIPVIIKLADSPEVCLPAKPLIWTLAFGACLGGNGTLIGASANVVCAGLAEQNGYKLSFVHFFKTGFPMMLLTTFVAMVYLIICHVVFDWDVTEC